MNFGTYSFPKKSYDFDMDSQGVVSLTAAATITRGDLVMSAPHGAIANGFPSTGPSPAPTHNATLASRITIAAMDASLGTSSAKLANGNMVVAYANTSNVIGFTIYSPTGTQVVAPTNIATGSVPIGGVSVAVLTSGNFVVAYGISSTAVRFAQYTSAGVIVGTITTVEAIGAPEGVSVTALTSGNFVVSYGNATAACKFAQYNPSNVIVGAITTVAAEDINATAVTGLQNGNFAVAWCTSNSPATRFAIYNASNAVVVSATVVESGINVTSIAAVTLTSGDFVLVWPNSGMRTARYTQAGVQVSAVTFIASAGSETFTSASALSNGGFAAVFGDLNSCRFLQCTPSGLVVGGAQTAFTTGTAASGAVCGLDNGDYAVFSSDTSNLTFRFSIFTTIASTTLPQPLQVDSAIYTQQYLSSVSTQTSVAFTAITRLQNGLFVAARTHNGGQLGMSVLNSFGVRQYYADVIVDAINLQGTVALTTLQNGNFVVAYRPGLSTDAVRFAIYAPDLTLVVGSKLVLAAPAGAAGVSLATMTNGDFVVAIAASSVTATRFTPAGVQVGSTVTIESAASTRSAVAALPNNAYVVSYLVTTSTVFKFATVNSSGVLATPPTVIETPVSILGNSIAVLSNGNFVVVYCSAASTKFVQLTQAGATVGSITIVAAEACDYTSVVSLPNGNFLIGYEVGAGARLAQYNQQNALVGSVGVVDSGTIAAGAITLLDNTNVASVVAIGSQVRHAIFTSSARSAQGVALNNAIAGETVRVRYLTPDWRAGSFTINNTVLAGTTFDHRSVGGIAGSVAGNVLFSRGYTA
jgi:hypothetical protein